jgi:hypothetical protein
LKGEIEKRNQFNKSRRTTLEKTIYLELRLNDEIENKSKFYKKAMSKN